MIAVDTNILVRVLVDDATASQQCRQSRELLNTVDGILISEIVLVETVWVLESAYSFTKDQILTALEIISRHPGIKIQSSELLATAINLFKQYSADFSDCLILTHALERHVTLHTYDKKLGRVPGAFLLNS